MISSIFKLFSNLLATLNAFASSLPNVKRIAAFILAGFLAFGFGVQAVQASETLGERSRDRIEKYDRSTERPKTMGQFRDEVEGDVPLGERIENTIRDSAQAFTQFGKEYSVGAQESAKNITDKAAETGERISDSVR